MTKTRLTAASKRTALTLLGLALIAATVAAGAFAAAQAAPANTAPPTISGTPRVGQTLTASNGTWTNAPTTYEYQWLRCNTAGSSCVPVANGTNRTYTLIPADAGHTMRVRVTASNADGSASAQSEPTQVVESSAVPRNTGDPFVRGTPEQGQTLESDTGDWTANPTSYAYQWQRCEADNIVACVDIPSATGKTYVVRAVDVGYRLRSEVTARNANGAAVEYSPTTAVIRPKLRITNKRPTLTILSVRLVGTKVYARFRVCDDSNKNVSIVQTDSRPGKASYTRRFSTLAAPIPCGVYTRHWTPASRFRGKGRYTVSLMARDKSGDTSAIARRTFTRR